MRRSACSSQSMELGDRSGDSSYAEGIVLKGGERILPFSEIHTLILVRAKGGWLFSAQDIVRRNCPKQREGSARSSDSSSRVWGNQNAVAALSGGH